MRRSPSDLLILTHEFIKLTTIKLTTMKNFSLLLSTFIHNIQIYELTGTREYLPSHFTLQIPIGGKHESEFGGYTFTFETKEKKRHYKLVGLVDLCSCSLVYLSPKVRNDCTPAFLQ